MLEFKYENITVGADPELFLQDKVTHQWVAACGKVGGTKEKPRKIDRRGHAVQEDNVMVEFNIPPCRTEKRFITSINHVLSYLRETLPQYDLVIAPSARFPEEQLQDERCHVFGCDPDFDAWNMLINTPPDVDTNLRTCGGHIHVGYKEPTEDSQIALVRAMDLFLGVPSIVLDNDSVRRSRYGKAGAFRPKPYGIEWRVASNYWIKDVQHISWSYQNVHKAVDFLNSGGIIDETLGAAIQVAINTGNVELAKDISREYKTLQGI